MVKSPPASAGDVGSIPGSGRSPGEGNGNPLQYSRLGNSMDRGTWWATVHGSKINCSSDFIVIILSISVKRAVLNQIFFKLVDIPEMPQG